MDYSVSICIKPVHITVLYHGERVSMQRKVVKELGAGEEVRRWFLIDQECFADCCSSDCGLPSINVLRTAH